MKEIKVGDRFGRLVVIKKITKGRSLLRCDCGNTLELVDSQLRSGYYRSCGCLIHHKGVRKNLVGKRYGRLVVTKELGHGYVMCHCDCGNDKKIRKWSLMQGGIHSCGCLRRRPCQVTAISNYCLKTVRISVCWQARSRGGTIQAASVAYHGITRVKNGWAASKSKASKRKNASIRSKKR